MGEGITVGGLIVSGGTIGMIVLFGKALLAAITTTGDRASRRADATLRLQERYAERTDAANAQLRAEMAQVRGEMGVMRSEMGALHDRVGDLCDQLRIAIPLLQAAGHDTTTMRAVLTGTNNGAN